MTEDIKIGSKAPIGHPMNKSEIIKCEIIKINKENDTYYIHYSQLNRRYDRWVKRDAFLINSSTSIDPPKKRKKILEKKYFEKAEEVQKIRNFDAIVIGNKKITTWYFSPYPREVIANKVVYICEFCLFYFSTQEQLTSHAASCDLRSPPGLMIYKDSDNNLTFFELDGYKHNNYCRNLSLISKLFLDHKSLIYDIDAFLFYVLCRQNSVTGYYDIVGYFAKEKFSEQGFNLACILCLPSEQKKGYGKILIDFSYMLSKKENLISGPEKPLSDLGLLGYRAYWLDVILEYIDQYNQLNIKDISLKSHISEDDIIGTLLANKMIKYHNDSLILVIDDVLKKKISKKRINKVYECYMITKY